MSTVIPEPCPFCGAMFTWESRYHNGAPGESTGSWVCRHAGDCFLEPGLTFFTLELSYDGVMFTDSYRAEKKRAFEDQILRWNRRTKEPK